MGKAHSLENKKKIKKQKEGLLEGFEQLQFFEKRKEGFREKMG